MTPAAAALPVDVAGEALVLLAERCVWWPRERALLVADVHFGKAAAFRAAGIALPPGTTADNLARLDALVGRLDASRIVFLGDFLHARLAPDARTFEAIAAWRARRSTLAVDLVVGNHDRRAGGPPARLRIACHAESLVAGPFALAHHPEPHAGRYTLAGHLHPALRLAGRGSERLRVPCFVLGAEVGLLPAFGAFTGTHPVRPRRGDRVYAVAGDRVVAMPSADRVGRRPR